MSQTFHHKLIAGVLVVAGIALAHMTLVPTPAKAWAKDCDNNAIIRCGLNDADPVNDFINKYNQNAPGDLQYIFGFNGIDLQSIRMNAKTGYVMKNGEVYLGSQCGQTGGRLVATGAKSAGRLPRPNQTTTVGANGVTYYYSLTRYAFRAECIPAIIIMNGNQFTKAILTSCGNLVAAKAVNPAPTYSCDALQKSTADGRTFRFSTRATATGGTQIAKVVYDFGDGSAPVKSSNPSRLVEHAYTQAGDYTAKVTVYVHINSVTFPIDHTLGCQQVIHVKPAVKPQPSKPAVAHPAQPAHHVAARTTVTTVKAKTEVATQQISAYVCSALTPKFVSGNRYEFTANAQVAGAAVLASADFDFGDGEAVTGVAPTSAGQVVVQHDYAQPGARIVKAVLYFDADGDGQTEAQGKECVAEITVAAAATTSAVVTASVTKKEETPPPAAPAQQQEEELPATGPGALAGGVFGLSGVMGAGYYYVSSRRKLMGSLFKIR